MSVEALNNKSIPDKLRTLIIVITNNGILSEN